MASVAVQLGELVGTHIVAAAAGYLSYRASANSRTNITTFSQPPPPPPAANISEAVTSTIADIDGLEGQPVHFATSETTWLTPCLFLAGFLVFALLCSFIRGDYQAVELENLEAEEHFDQPETALVAEKLERPQDISDESEIDETQQQRPQTEDEAEHPLRCPEHQGKDNEDCDKEECEHPCCHPPPPPPPPGRKIVQSKGAGGGRLSAKARAGIADLQGPAPPSVPIDDPVQDSESCEHQSEDIKFDSAGVVINMRPKKRAARGVEGGNDVVFDSVPQNILDNLERISRDNADQGGDQVEAPVSETDHMPGSSTASSSNDSGAQHNGGNQNGSFGGDSSDDESDSDSDDEDDVIITGCDN